MNRIARQKVNWSAAVMAFYLLHIVRTPQSSLTITRQRAEKAQVNIFQSSKQTFRIDPAFLPFWAKLLTQTGGCYEFCD